MVLYYGIFFSIWESLGSIPIIENIAKRKIIMLYN